MRGRILAFDATLSFPDIRRQISDIGIGQSGLERRDRWTALFYFCNSVRIVDGVTGHHALVLVEALKVGPSLGIFVVAHPTLKEIYVFAAGRAAVGKQLVMIQPGRALQIVSVNDFTRRRLRLLGRRLCR